MQDARDSTLSILAGRFLAAIFRQHDHREFRVDRTGCAEPGKTGTDDQHIGEEVRYLLGGEGYQVSL
jgi:hypothetical protein